MKLTLPFRIAGLFVAWACMAHGAVAKGPPPNVRVDVHHAGSTTTIFDAGTAVDLYDQALGTVLLEEGDSVTFNITWTYASQDVSVFSSDTNWFFFNWFGSLPSALMVGAIGEITISAWGIEWGYQLHLVTAVPDTDAHPVAVRPFARLGGAYRDGSSYMGTELCTNGLLPLTEQYSSMGWMLPGTGGETAMQEVLEPQQYPGNNVVDWVLLELRNAADPATVVANKCGLLKCSGQITAEDGTSPVIFMAPYGDYHLVVRHRNHLGIMSAQTFNAMTLPTDMPLSVAANVMNGATAGIPFGSDYFVALCPGNAADGDGPVRITYSGAVNDRDAILQRVGGSVPTNTASGYYREDINLDGLVKYAGEGNDRDVVLQSIGGLSPTAVRNEDLP